MLDLGEEKDISGVITQGNYSIGEWVTSYYVDYSNDNSNWVSAQNSNGDDLFIGNTDNSTKVYNYFNNSITTRYVKIKPETWFQTAIIMNNFSLGNDYWDGLYLSTKNSAIESIT